MGDTIYMPPEAVRTCTNADAWLYEQGAPLGSHWTSPGLLPDGGRMWLRREPGDFTEQLDMRKAAPVQADV